MNKRTHAMLLLLSGIFLVGLGAFLPIVIAAILIVVGIVLLLGGFKLRRTARREALAEKAARQMQAQAGGQS